MHGHGLFNNVDQQLVDSMMKHFEWVHTAQVKTSIARQFTVSVSVKASFYEHNEDEPTGKYVVGAIGEAGTPLEVMDAQFLDDSRLIAVSDTDAGAVIALYALSDLNEPIWQRTVATGAASRVLVALVGSRGRHLSWVVFLAIGAIVLAVSVR